MKALLAAVVLVPTLALTQSNDITLPLQPAHAADQTQITSRSLQEEFDQFRALSEWQKATDLYKDSQLKLAQAQKEFERIKVLHDSHTITESTYETAYFKLRTLQDEVIRQPLAIDKAKLTAQFHMLRVSEEGNPGDDRRADLANLMVNGIEEEITTLKSSLELAKAGQALAQGFRDNGLVLAKRNSLAAEALEKRELVLAEAKILVEAIEKQIALTQMALVSFQKSKDKLPK